MTEFLRPVPAIKLGKAGALERLFDKLMRAADLESMMTTPLANTIVLPLNEDTRTDQRSIVELSVRGVSVTTFFLHCIHDPQMSTRPPLDIVRSLVEIT